MKNSKTIEKAFDHLMLIKQDDNEHLNEYAKRFYDEVMQVEDYIDQVIVQIMLAGLQLGYFKWDIVHNLPKKLSAMIEEA